MKGKQFLIAGIVSLSVVGTLFVAAIGAQAAKPSSPAKAKVSEGPVAVANSLLVKVKASENASVKAGKSNTGLEKVDALLRSKEVKGISQLARVHSKAKTNSPLFQWYQVSLPGDAKTLKASAKADGTWGVERNSAGRQLEKVAHTLRTDPRIETVEPDYVVATQAVPNDPYYGTSGTWGQAYRDLWGLEVLGMETAWDHVTNASGVIVADIDSGVDRNHPDLLGNMWVNVDEIPSNGIDDDMNGYIDDYHGWDWRNNDNDPMDDHGHGTHTVGTISASGNNGIGVTGVAWSGRVMALKFLDNNGGGSLSSGVAAMQYAADMGAKVSSNSWGCSYCFSKAVDDAVNYQHDRGMVVVVAAGNGNTNSLYYSPASSQRAVTVAASNAAGERASFSNRGVKIDVSAPGVDILSTRASVNPMCTPEQTVGQDYCRVSGTSMSTPHVAGLAALMLSKEPTLTNEQVRTLLRQYATDAGDPGFDGFFGYGIAHAGRTVTSATNQATTALITSPRNYADITSTADVIGTADGPRFQSYKLEYGEGIEPAAWVTFSESTTPVVSGNLGRLPYGVLTENSLYSIRLVVTDTDGTTHTSSIHELTANEIIATITQPEEVIDYDVIDLVGSVEVGPGDALDHYTIEWAKENDIYGDTTPLVWSTENMSLAGGGQLEVSDSVLATWDNSAYPGNRNYYFRLTVHTTSGKTDTFERGYHKLIPDREPPTISFVKPTDQMVVGRTLDVELDAQDNFGSPRVELLLDGAVIANYDYYPYGGKFDTSAYTGGAHELVAIAYDRAGYSTVSEPITITLDHVAPTVTFTKPLPNSSVGGSLITLQADASDASGIAKVEFRQGTNLVGVSMESPYQANWDGYWKPDGIYEFVAIAYDTVGNSTTTTVSVYLDKTAPTVSVVSPEYNALVAGTVTINAEAQDLSGIQDVEFYIDNRLMATDTSAPYSYDWDTRGLPHGTAHSIKVVASDVFGRTNYANGYVTVQDIVSPTTAITYPANGSTVARDSNIIIRASATDASPISRVEFYVDGSLRCTDTSATFDCAWRTAKRRGTTSTIYVKTYDVAGNVTTSAPVSVTTL